jgi:hypothetical protein
MDNQYHEKCRHVVEKFIEGKTRFDLKSPVLSDFKAFDFQFAVEISCALDADWSCKTFVGECVKGQSIGHYEKQDCEKALQRVTLEELDNSEILTLLKQTQQAKAYYYSSEKFMLKNNAKQVSHVHECPDCNGYGAVTCPSCNGAGCVICSSCEGSGEDAYTFTGDILHCFYCKGRKTICCTTCSGEGRVRCKTCKGKQSFTDVYTLSVYATPTHRIVFPEGNVADYIVQAVDKATKSSLTLAGYGELSRIKLVENPKKRAVIDIYNAKVPFARFSTPSVKNTFNWVIFGKEPEIFDSGNILDFFLRDDLEALKKSAKMSSPSVITSISNFMKSKSNQEILDWDGRTVQSNNKINLDVRAEKIREHMGKSFSLEYIKDSLAAMEKRVRSICIHSNLKWYVFLSLLSFFITWGAPVVGSYPITEWPHAIGQSCVSFSRGEIPASFFLAVFLVFLIGSFIACTFRAIYLKKIGSIHLSNWAGTTKFYNSQWIVFSVLGILSVAAISYALGVAVLFINSRPIYAEQSTEVTKKTKVAKVQVKNIEASSAFPADSIVIPMT